MAIKSFLLQGFTANTHLDALRRLFVLPDLEGVILSVAFVNEAGVDLLAPELANASSKVDVFAGIRNDITSFQGLDALMVHGANVHYVDTGARQLLFHPKVYFARSATKALMVVGSANLTPGGLNNNIEASVVIELDLTNTADRVFAESVAAEFAELTHNYPEHVVRLQDRGELEKLQQEGRLLDEISSPPPRTVAGAVAAEADHLGRIKLKVQPLGKKGRGSAAKTRSTTSSARPAVTASPSKTPAVPTGAELELLWASKPLTERDLTIPSGSNTNSTGSINLDKGLLRSDIDHRHYFREEVFKALSWKKKSDTVDEAFAMFGLIVKGGEYREFKLRIAHTTNYNSRSYLQRNAMTRLSWGNMKPYIAQKELIGHTMSLYHDAVDPTRFVIQIN